jgi:DNA-binding CsgD family transcriptional regulator
MFKVPSLLLNSVHDINKMAEKLKKIGVCIFNHDITFGEGRIAILTSNEGLLKFYCKNEHPAAFTDVTGRILAPNIYLHNYLNENYTHYKRVISPVYSKFNFNSSIHIVEKEEDCQHLFSFFSTYKDALFLQNLFNNFDTINNFLFVYKKLGKELILKAKNKNNQIILPYSSNDSNNTLNTLLTNNKNSAYKNDLIVITNQFTNKKVKLSLRQSQCLDFLARGYTAKEIAKEMILSSRTIEHYIERVREILNCRNNKELIANFILSKNSNI